MNPLRAATKKLSKSIHDFAETTYIETGARLIIMGGYVNSSRKKTLGL